MASDPYTNFDFYKSQLVKYIDIAERLKMHFPDTYESDCKSKMYEVAALCIESSIGLPLRPSEKALVEFCKNLFKK